MTKLTVPPLILASGSPWRRELLARLGMPFETVTPDVDERRQHDEQPAAMARRLATVKAEAVARQRPGALIIGSDQVAVCGERLLGKPGDASGATAQLRAVSGLRVDFFTGICLLNGFRGARQNEVVEVSVWFRRLTDEQITSYVAREQPFSCAAAFKSEGLGIALIERFGGDDPSALIGLPLIRLTQMLEAEGIAVL